MAPHKSIFRAIEGGAGFARGGARPFWDARGGGAPPRPPSFCASGAGSLTSPALIETPWHAYSTIWYTLVVQLRTKFKTIQLCSLLMCIET